MAGDETYVEPDVASAEVRRLIASGESGTVEFKASMRYDYQTQSANRDLTKVIAKTVAGFLNVSGGTLLIGVSDDRSLVGLDRDVESLPKRTLDAFEIFLRNAIATYLGVEIGPRLSVRFVELDGVTIARVHCPAHDKPVFVRDADRQEFYVRDGNQTRPLDVRASHEYIRSHWPTAQPASDETIRRILADTLSEQLRPLLQEALDKATAAPPSVDNRLSTVGREIPPDWIRIATRQVLNLFLGLLATSPGWKRIYLISPWLSDIEHSASMTSDQFLKRIRDDGATGYVVTRPPVEQWHSHALTRLADTGRVNVALVPGLHTKLYTALTSRGSFAMLGSANFTQQALTNREIGLLVTSFGDGQRLVSELHHEAASIYRLPERHLLHQASFRPY